MYNEDLINVIIIYAGSRTCSLSEYRSKRQKRQVNSSVPDNVSRKNLNNPSRESRSPLCLLQVPLSFFLHAVSFSVYHLLCVREIACFVFEIATNIHVLEEG